MNWTIAMGFNEDSLLGLLGGLLVGAFVVWLFSRRRRELIELNLDVKGFLRELLPQVAVYARVSAVQAIVDNRPAAPTAELLAELNRFLVAEVVATLEFRARATRVDIEVETSQLAKYRLNSWQDNVVASEGQLHHLMNELMRINEIAAEFCVQNGVPVPSALSGDSS